MIGVRTTPTFTTFKGPSSITPPPPPSRTSTTPQLWAGGECIVVQSGTHQVHKVQAIRPTTEHSVTSHTAPQKIEVSSSQQDGGSYQNQATHVRAEIHPQQQPKPQSTGNIVYVVV